MKRTISFFLSLALLSCAAFTAKAEATVVLSEDFSSVTAGNSTGTGGSSTAWNGDNLFPTVNTAYNAGGAVKIGSGSASGSITSKELDLSAGSVTVAFDVKGWSSVEGSITVSLSSGASSTVEYTAVMGGSFESKSVTFSAGSSADTVTIATTKKRAFIDNVVVSVEPVNKVRNLVATDVTQTSFTLNADSVPWADSYGITLVSRAYDVESLIDEPWSKVESSSTSALTENQFANATYTQVSGWSGVHSYRYLFDTDAGNCSGGAVRLGNTSNDGYLQTPAFANLARGTTLTVEFDTYVVSSTTRDGVGLRIATVRADGSDRDWVQISPMTHGTSLSVTGSNALRLQAGPGDSIRFTAVSDVDDHRIVLDNIVVKEVPALETTTVNVASLPYIYAAALPGRRYVATVVAKGGDVATVPVSVEVETLPQTHSAAVILF